MTMLLERHAKIQATSRSTSAFHADLICRQASSVRWRRQYGEHDRSARFILRSATEVAAHVADLSGFSVHERMDAPVQVGQGRYGVGEQLFVCRFVAAAVQPAHLDAGRVGDVEFVVGAVDHDQRGAARVGRQGRQRRADRR